MPPSTKFDYSRGSAFVHNGYLYYSPNCQRNVVIPPPPVGHGEDPFKKGRRFNATDFLQPVWWSEPYGWLSFVPLAPTFLSYPFEPLSWVPKIVSVDVSADPNSSEPQPSVTRYTLAFDESSLWMQKEAQVVEAARLLRFAHAICGTPPPLPSTFGFHRHHKSRALAQKMASLARGWFGVWMGYLAYIIQQTIASPYRKVDPNSPNPYWYQLLLKDRKFSLAWLDGLASSPPVCEFSKSVSRAGIVIPWTVANKTRPTIEFFLDRNVPVFFPWNSTTEDAIRGDRRLAHLRPPVELIQSALTFILRSPDNVPVAALIMKRFCDLESQISNPEAARLLRLRYASSEVVDFVAKHFLDQYDLLAQFKDDSDAVQALREAADAHHQQNMQNANAAAALPQQGMIEKDGQQNLYGDWKDFFRKRAARMPEILKGASDTERQAFANRRRQPPQKKTKVFIWDEVVTSGGLSVWSRKQVDQRGFEGLFSLDEPRVYNEVLNEWDVFPEFWWDTTSPEEDGVPPVRLAPPVEGQAVADSNNDNNNEYSSHRHSASPSQSGTNSSANLQPFNDYYDTDDDGDYDMYARPSSHQSSAVDSNQYRPGQTTHPVVNAPPASLSQSSTHSSANVQPFNDYYDTDDDGDYDMYARPSSHQSSAVDSNQYRPGQTTRPVVNAPPASSRRAPSPIQPHSYSSRSGQSAHRPPVNVSSSRCSKPSRIAPASDVATRDDHYEGILEEDISSDTPLLQALQYNYGYTRRVHKLPSSQPRLDWRGVGLALGHQTSLPSNNEDLSIRHFVSALAYSIPLPAEMNDLDRHNFSPLHEIFDFRNIVRPHKEVFIFVELSSRSSSCRWLLSVRSPVAALYVVRYLSLNPGHTALTVAHRLIKYGIPFNTFLLGSSSLTPPEPVCFVPRFRHEKYSFTVADFDSAMLACKARLEGPAGRAALLQGGIIARIAREFVSIDLVLDGPSNDAVERSLGFVIDSESLGRQYRDDALTEEDIYVICGCYSQFTGYGAQAAQYSYFPRPSDWYHKDSGFAWLEWTNASEAMFQKIMLNNKAGKMPLKAAEWRTKLRGTGFTRSFLDANKAQSASFVDLYCPVRPRW